MLTRSGLIALVTLLLAVPAGAAPLTRYVDTRTGTDEGAPDFGTGGGAGATFPGAVAPFGMLQVSPDTEPGYRNYSGMYTHSDTQIKGFGLAHLSGAGCSALGDVPFLPTTHPVDASPSTLGSYDVEPRYIAKFTHDGEVARPGDYRVTLNPGANPIGVELTAVARGGAMRFTFPAGAGGSVLVNAGGSSMGNDIADLQVDPERREISGTVVGGAFCSALDRYRLHFVAQFDTAFAGSGTWVRQTVTPGSTAAGDTALTKQVSVATLQYKRTTGLPDSLPGHPSTGAQAGAYASFGPGPVTARVAVSSVSVEGARRNLAAAGSGSFEAMRAQARRAWNRRLGQVRIGGGTHTQRELFYTALYHAQIHPSLFSDADGQYRGMDGEIHTAKGFRKFVNVSGWDTYRAQLPLMAILAPGITSDFVSSLISDWRESGHLPKWSLREGQTNVMVGDPADLLIAGANAYGAKRFDRATALQAMVDGATKPGISDNAGYIQRAGLDDYLRLGYVGYEQNTSTIGQAVDPSKVWGTAATTLEYALADFGIARLAAAIGEGATCQTFAKRADNWRKVFDPQTGLMRPRRADGSFVRDAPATTEEGFVEGSAAQYTWFVPQDMAGLIKALGGRKAALAKLDHFFAQLNDGPESEHAFLGNEPTLHTPYLYDWLGAPGRGAAAVRKALLGLYKPTPGGFPGNDDLGAMSAWWVFGALGLHPTVPGTDVLTLGSPLFPRARVKLPGGTLTIRAPQAAAGTPYVRRATLDGKPLNRTWVPFRKLRKGGRLGFAVSADANQAWGTGRRAAPPSFGGARACG
ncbi:MAG: GH92 family glycosyl hydrolase [Solirubrobacteraceae bacterium]